MEFSETIAYAAELGPPCLARLETPGADVEVPPATRKFLQSILARAQVLCGPSQELSRLQALLRRRRGDDTDRLEGDMLARVARGDSDALALLEDRYATALRALMMLTRVGGPDEDDILQEVRVKLWQSALRFDSKRGSVAVWVLSIAHHRMVDERRRRRRMLRRNAAAAVPPEDAAVETDLDGLEEARRVASAIMTLDAPLRAVLHEAADDLSHAEIAAALDLPIGTVKTRIRRAQKLIRAALGVDPPGEGDV